MHACLKAYTFNFGMAKSNWLTNAGYMGKNGFIINQSDSLTQKTNQYSSLFKSITT